MLHELPRKTERLEEKLLAYFEAPDDLTVSQWAEQKRRLSAEASAEPGKWRNKRTPYLVEVMDAFTDPKVRHITMVAASQVGKALAIDTPIVTPSGWTTMGDLKVGDTIYDELGEECKVTFVTEVMNNRPCYRMTFSDGSEIIADAEHKWFVSRLNDHLTEHTRVTTTAEMLKDFKLGKRNRYAIDVAPALQCSEKELPIPPYTLGYWLGDGNSYSNQITVSADDAEIIDYIKADGIPIEVRRKNGRVLNLLLDRKISVKERDICDRGHDMRVLGRTKRGLCAECARQSSKHFQYDFVMDEVTNRQTTLYMKLCQLGLIGRKRIPMEYLRASYDQRLSLLQGILDSDGSIRPDGRSEITLKSKELIYDVHELLLTLGIKNNIKERLSKCSNAVGGPKFIPTYRISFMSYDQPIFRLKRKAIRIKTSDGVGRTGCPLRTTETYRRRIINIEPIDSVPVKCIQVDSPNHLYLAGREMIPTHNTEAELNMIGYIIDEDPGSILFVHPTVVDAKEFSKLRIDTMMRDTPSIRNKVTISKRRDSSNTILQKSYPGGILTLCGSTEAHALASKPIRYVIGDERDRWAGSAGSEGDPWDLAMARQTTFYNAKAVEVSTPTIKNASAIEAAYNTGTMERWVTKCPHCGEYEEIKWANIRFEYDTNVVNHKKTYTVTDIYYVCPICGCISTEQQMKKSHSKWTATNPSAYNVGHRSFWLNAFSSQWASWESIIIKYLNAMGSSQKMQVVYNTCFGELWENRGDLQDEEGMLSRREDYGTADDGSEVELPEGVLVLTCGVDTQDNRLEYEVVGHGHFSETWGIRKGVIMGRPDDPEVWKALDDVISHVYRFKNGRGLKVSLTFVDEGGHFTQEVRIQCNARISKKVFCIKGIGGQDHPFTSPPKKQRILSGGRAVGNCWQYQIGVDAGKQKIMDNLKVATPGSRYCHFPKRDDYGPNYFNGLLSEHLVYKEGLKHPWQWEKIPGHERNENLDCRVYALAAFKSLSVDLDQIDYRLKNTSEEKKQEAAPVVNVQRPQPIKVDRRPKVSRYYDSW